MPLKQEPRGEAVHRDREEALGLRAVDVHRDDLLHPRHLQHPGNQLGRDRLPLVRLLVVTSVNVNCLSLEIEIQSLLFTSHTELMEALPLSAVHRPAYTP